MNPHDEHEHGMVMPFNVVASVGGPFDDDSFVAGWTCAQVREALQHSGVSWTGTVREGVLPQLDLIAMERGLRLLSREVGDGWAIASIDAHDLPEDQR